MNKSDAFQAINGTGMDWLQQQLLASVPRCQKSDVLITNIRHKEALDLALADIDRTIQAMNMGMTGDLISEDLRQCLHHLSDILGGQITPPTKCSGTSLLTSAWENKRYNPIIINTFCKESTKTSVFCTENGI